MVKRITFWEMGLLVTLAVVGCACGFAVAKDTLILKYLPVDHDVDMKLEDVNITLRETNNAQAQRILKNHVACLRCGTYTLKNQQQCPDCCLYNDNTTSYCNPGDPTVCPPPQGAAPFNSTCAECEDCDTTFKRDCCEGKKCSKYPSPLIHCLSKGCGNTKPRDPSCIWNGMDNAWYCKSDDLPPSNECVPNNPNITNCSSYRLTHQTAYRSSDFTPLYDKCGLSAAGDCFKYIVNDSFTQCVADCNSTVNTWEENTYQRVGATHGKKVCDTGNCTSGFNNNCNATVCDQRINEGCFDKYSKSNCKGFEDEYRDFLFADKADCFLPIAESFEKKFVARSGERYMINWQILCNVVPDPSDTKDKYKDYNLYTRVVILEQGTNFVVYRSPVHQKALGSTFFISAQTGTGAEASSGLKQGKGYTIKIYYFLPNDGETPLRVDVSALQLILYRTKN